MSCGFLFFCGSVLYDDCINILFLYDSLECIKELCNFIVVLDKLVQQVFIELCIVVVIDQFICEFGVKFGV